MPGALHKVFTPYRLFNDMPSVEPQLTHDKPKLTNDRLAVLLKAYEWTYRDIISIQSSGDRIGAVVFTFLGAGFLIAFSRPQGADPKPLFFLIPIGMFTTLIYSIGSQCDGSARAG